MNYWPPTTRRTCFQMPFVALSLTEEQTCNTDVTPCAVQTSHCDTKLSVTSDTVVLAPYYIQTHAVKCVTRRNKHHSNESTSRMPLQRFVLIHVLAQHTACILCAPHRAAKRNRNVNVIASEHYDPRELAENIHFKWISAESLKPPYKPARRQHFAPATCVYVLAQDHTSVWVDDKVPSNRLIISIHWSALRPKSFTYCTYADAHTKKPRAA